MHPYGSAAPYPVRPARPRPYLDFEKYKAAAAAAARCNYRGLAWLGRTRRTGAAPVGPLESLRLPKKCDALIYIFMKNEKISFRLLPLLRLLI